LAGCMRNQHPIRARFPDASRLNWTHPFQLFVIDSVC